MTSGLFIVFEGFDFSGTTTQQEMLTSWLRSQDKYNEVADASEVGPSQYIYDIKTTSVTISELKEETDYSVALCAAHQCTYSVIVTTLSGEEYNDSPSPLCISTPSKMVGDVEWISTFSGYNSQPPISLPIEAENSNEISPGLFLGYGFLTIIRSSSLTIIRSSY